MSQKVSLPENLDRLPDGIAVDARFVCAMCRCSEAKLYRDIKLGRFPRPIKLGASSRWKLGTIRALLNGETAVSVEGV